MGKDYSLTGGNSSLAREKGLADATWYRTPVPRAKMRELLTRRDGPAIRDTLIWLGLLAGSGYAGFMLWGTAWAIIPFAIYGVIYATTSDSRWHEAGHGTAFKTNWMNNALYELASFMVLRESTVWRWSHAKHHSDTIIVGVDPEVGPARPIQPKGLIEFFFGYPMLIGIFNTCWGHARGRITPAEKTFIPEAEWRWVIIKARIYLAIFAGVVTLAIITQSILPLMYVGLPTLYGSWLMPFYGYTQHLGLAEDVLDHRLNSRTVYMNGLNRYLYWNMNYHVEHHMFPLVPYHALPRLHELVKHDLPKPYNGIIEAFREIIPALKRQMKEADFFVSRELPPPGERTAPDMDMITVVSDGKATADGWVTVGCVDLIAPEDVIRFDHGDRSLAIYQTKDNKIYATDGYCTHGRSHLAAGLLRGCVIECGKHNGRFNVQDGSPCRKPVTVPVRTYSVRLSGDRIEVKLA